MFEWRRRRSGAAQAGTAQGDEPAVAASLRCSFCGKGPNDVSKLIAGPTVYICDECVDVCVDILGDERLHDESRPPDSSALPDINARDLTICGLCRQPVARLQALPVDGRGLLCGECADAVEAALSQGKPIDPNDT